MRNLVVAGHKYHPYTIPLSFDKQSKTRYIFIIFSSRPFVKLQQNGLLLSIINQVRLHGLISYLWTTAAHLTQFRTMFLSVNFTKPTAFVHRFCNGLHLSLQVVANVLCLAVLVLIGQMSYLGCPRAPF